MQTRKESFIAKEFIPMFFLLLLISGVCLYYGHSKSGMFIDEIYTYGLSNSTKGAFLKDCARNSEIIGRNKESTENGVKIQDNEILPNEIITDVDTQGGGYKELEDIILKRQDLLDYVTVQSDERFSFSSVYDNQSADVHPPLYYWIFHIASSFTPDVFSKWTGLVLNLLLYLGILILLYILLRDLFNSRIPALAGIAIYGLSQMGLSTMLMIRMYVLLTFLTVLLAWCVTRLMQKQTVKLYILTCLTIFAGVMTQYYYVFYAFFVCVMFVFYTIRKQDWKTVIFFSISCFTGIFLLLICFPPCIQHLFADKLVSGGNALENLKATSQYWNRLVFYSKEILHGMRASVVMIPAIVLVMFFLSKQLLCCIRKGQFSFHAVIIILPAFITLAVIAIISPVQATRYIYNLCPIFAVAVVIPIAWLDASTTDIPIFRSLKTVALSGVLLCCLWFACRMEPSYQYLKYTEYNATLSSYNTNPCVYLTDNYNAPLTQDLEQLLLFDEFFITSTPESGVLKKYLTQFKNKDCVVYIDVDEFWSSGFEADILLPKMLSHGYDKYLLLYSNGLSECYLLTNMNK